MTFDQAIANFVLKTAKEVIQMIESGDDVIAFIGRETCPYCQRFAPKLAQVQVETGAEIYFVDSTSVDDPDLSNLRSSYSILTVPGLLVATDSQARVVCDSSLSLDAIKAFMT